MKNFRVYCDDILESIELIREYVADADFANFSKNREMQDAIIRRLEIIGEAVRYLPEQLKKDHPGIPWKDIAGTRDWLIHRYDRVNLETVWAIIEKDLESLEKQIKMIVGKTRQF